MNGKVLSMVMLLALGGCASAVQSESASNALSPENMQYTQIENIDDHSQIRKALAQVNILVNSNIEYAYDITQYGVDDYWASPQEVVANGKGDCEDYAFLKRDILIKMGIPKERFKIIHADVIESSSVASPMVEQHIVLAYYRDEQSNNPIILDNMRTEVMYLRSRTDFHLNYVFDESTVWEAKGKKPNKVIYNTDILPKYNRAISGSIIAD